MFVRLSVDALICIVSKECEVLMVLRSATLAFQFSSTNYGYSSSCVDAHSLIGVHDVLT